MVWRLLEITPLSNDHAPDAPQLEGCFQSYRVGMVLVGSGIVFAGGCGFAVSASEVILACGEAGVADDSTGGESDSVEAIVGSECSIAGAGSMAVPDKLVESMRRFAVRNCWATIPG